MLGQADLRPKIGSQLLKPCADWVLVDSACSAYSMVSVPLYDTLGPDAVRYICGHAELAAVACAATVLPTLLQCLGECPTVALVVRTRQHPKRQPCSCWLSVGVCVLCLSGSSCIVLGI